MVIGLASVVLFVLLLAILFSSRETQPAGDGSDTKKAGSNDERRTTAGEPTGIGGDESNPLGTSDQSHEHALPDRTSEQSERLDQSSVETKDNGDSSEDHTGVGGNISEQPPDSVSADHSSVHDDALTPDATANAFFTLGTHGDSNQLAGTSDATTPMPDASISSALSGRAAGAREDMLRTYGGTTATEAAVKLGLEWLARNQQENGLWSLMGPYDDGSPVENVSAATAMALIAFQGAGHTHRGDRDDPYTKVVAKGSAALIEHAFKSDDAKTERIVGGGYTEAMCTIAICELYGMTQDRKFRVPAQQAAKYCLEAQSPAGGWRYSPRRDSDTSVTGWFVMALQSARMAGLKVPRQTFDGASGYLDQVQNMYGSQYSYQPGVVTTPSMTAEALLCRQYLGWRHDDHRLQDGAQFLVSHLPDRKSRDVYYWYYATQVCHHMGGDYWKRWNNVMRELLPSMQVKEGQERGSWNPNGDRWGGQGGRLYVTCMSLYALEVYYRHLPLYREAAVTGTP